MTIGGQTLSGPRGGLPHGGQLVDRRLDAEAQSAVAIYKQLNDYKSGSRVHEFMTPLAQGLDTISDRL